MRKIGRGSGKTLLLVALLGTGCATDYGPLARQLETNVSLLRRSTVPRAGADARTNADMWNATERGLSTIAGEDSHGS